MARIVYLVFLWLSVIFSFSTAFAQQDSIVYQHWKRDPNSDIESTLSNQKQIITREQILYSGYTLVSDVLQLVDGWSMSTWNGDRWNMQNGSGNYQTQNWTLLLNGQRIELMKLDAQNINTLGISVYDIERIEIVNVAGNYLGEFNDKGIIHIITKKSVDGLTYRGFASNGNEIGDPHLNTLNNPGLNVHMYGAVIANYLSFRKNKWDFQVSQYLNDYFYRDTTPLIYPLVKQYNPNTPWGNTILSGKIQVSYTSSRMTHQLSAIANRADDVVMPAGIFNPVTGSHNYNSVGYSMSYFLQKGIIRYRGSLMLRSFTGADQKSISHEQQYQTHNVNYTTRKTTLKGEKISVFGLAYDYINTQLNDTTPAINNQSHLIRPYFSYTHPLTKKSNVFTDISVATNMKLVIPKLSVGYYKQPSIISNWSFVGSFAQRCLAENNSYFSMLQLTDSSSATLSDDLSGSATLDYYYNINVNKYFKISFNSGIKYLFNELYFKPTTTFNTASPVLLYTEIDQMQQTRWVNRLNVHYDMLKNTRFDINYLRTTVFNDSWASQNNIPKHRFSFVLVQNLPARLNIWARYYYQSSSYWMNPALMSPPYDTGSQPLYTKLSPVHTFDIGITKRLLKEYLVINLSLRNVLNGSEHYQPNGTTFYMRLFLSFRVNIDGLFAGNK